MPGVRFCLSVCLSTRTALAATAFVSTSNERHLRHYYRLFLNFNSWIFEKAFRSNHRLELAANRFRALSGPTKHRDHLQDNLSVESCFRRKLLEQPPRNKRDQRHLWQAHIRPRPHAAPRRMRRSIAGSDISCHNLPPIIQHFLPHFSIAVVGLHDSRLFRISYNITVWQYKQGPKCAWL